MSNYRIMVWLGFALFLCAILLWVVGSSFSRPSPNSASVFGTAVVGIFLAGSLTQAAAVPGESLTVAGQTHSDFRVNDNDFRSGVLGYSDQDLSGSRYGQLVARITAVAGRLCDEVSRPDVWNLDQRQTCVNTAVHDAIARLNEAKAGG